MTTATYVLALIGALLCGVGLGIALCSPTIERLRGDVEALLSPSEPEGAA